MYFKMYFVICFFCLFQIGFGRESLSTLKTVKLYAKEMVVIKGEKKYSEYELSIELPDKMKKIQFSPEMNKGEIYIYKKDEKLTYLPFFNQVSKEKISPSENSILNYLNTIVGLEKKDKEFKKNYIENGTVTLLNKNSEKIILKELKEFQNILFPTKVEVYDNSGERVAEINLEKIEINPKFGKDEFEFENK